MLIVTEGKNLYVEIAYFRLCIVFYPLSMRQNFVMCCNMSLEN
jgi:hypothetical protein